ncbi:unnamed protein product [Mytilus coruscus]|uniref:Endonuclease/exonuclease/phosphatase domain-containing protein n=1 Tax=Mytilus coruscus TaxID=42192 RepID=A0A6J8C6K3_MYTCO|nr:unnamed protein product [Mytilus coruscus]
MDNVATNVSDHYPVSAKVKYIINAKEKSKCSNSKILPMSGKTLLKKINKDAYKTLVEKGLDNLSSFLENKYEVDLAFQNMNSLLFNSAKSCCPAPRKRFRKPKLKVMNQEISDAIAMKKKAFYQWKINGRSEDPRNELYIHKKETTYNLRKHCRKAVAMNRIDKREKIMEVNIKNKNSFYRLIKKQRGRLSNHIDELSVGDTVAYFDSSNSGNPSYSSCNRSTRVLSFYNPRVNSISTLPLTRFNRVELNGKMATKEM